ncbi:MAG: NUDIX domain-containing protein [Zoogloeaceae bacterium]|jgi:bifunctional NMN adenylyltransferase/nudix hydrolase|nr:NUDIX domain-containing protein [Zoogloeaceae bacterium]
MHTERFDVAVLIGRFQPFHRAHAALLRAALAAAGRVLLVLGSAFQARSARNPFTWEERAAMIGACLDAGDVQRVDFVPVRDYYDDRRWAAAVGEAVRAKAGQEGDALRFALVGFHKDASSRYLDLFAQWHFLAMPCQGEIDASTIRRIYFTDKESAPASLHDLVPPAVFHFLGNWAAQPAFAAMQEEYLAIEAGKARWGTGPFITLDAVVTAARHVLLVRRRNAPGKGLWAIPGGFLEGRERLLEGAIRELKEETRLQTADTDLAAALRAVAVFDHPERSQRGRVITHAHWFALPCAAPPAVAGADDASEARWFPVARLAGMESMFFEDHFHILNCLGIL